MLDKMLQLSVKTGFFRSRQKIRQEIEVLIDRLRAGANQGLNLGCGDSRLPNLTNCDFYNPAADLKADATDLSMFADGEVDYIESNHMIEHLSTSAVRVALAEWHRVLCTGGVLVITCPEFREIAWKWWGYSMLALAGRAEKKLARLETMIVGSQENDGMFHRSVFDKRTLPSLLRLFGFNVRFVYSRYPLRSTPSMVVIAEKLERC